VGSLKESSFDTKADRVEIFSNRAEKRKKYYGILRQLFVAFSSESNLLRLAGASSNVIEVHALRHDEEEVTIVQKKAIIENRLVLKRLDEPEGENEKSLLSNLRQRAPRLLVSRHWLDLMELRSGDRVIVSNPLENYEAPPPTVTRTGVRN